MFHTTRLWLTSKISVKFNHGPHEDDPIIFISSSGTLHEDWFRRNAVLKQMHDSRPLTNKLHDLLCFKQIKNAASSEYVSKRLYYLNKWKKRQNVSFHAWKSNYKLFDYTLQRKPSIVICILHLKMFICFKQAKPSIKPVLPKLVRAVAQIKAAIMSFHLQYFAS